MNIHPKKHLMRKYEEGKINKLSKSLKKAGIARGLISQIMKGGEAIRNSATPQEKADWLKKAMLRMDELLDKDTRQAVREACACCLGGKRLKLSSYRHTKRDIKGSHRSGQQDFSIFSFSLWTWREDAEIWKDPSILCPRGFTGIRM